MALPFNGVWLLDSVVIFSRLAVWFVFVFVVWKTAVPNRILRPYSFRVKILWMLPLNTRWQEQIAPEHLDAIRRFRRGFFAGFAAILVFGLLRFLYFDFFFMRLHGFDIAIKNMSLHTEHTDLRPQSDADKARAATLVTDIQHALAKYQDYHVAEVDGFKSFHPEMKAPVVDFTKNWPGLKDELAFNASEPFWLLYQRTPDGGYKLISAKYTCDDTLTEDQLNDSVPLSVARWHRNMNVCLPARGTDTKTVDWTKFGFVGSIATKQACDAVGGRFSPRVSGWTIKVHPWEQNAKQVWAQ